MTHFNKNGGRTPAAGRTRYGNQATTYGSPRFADRDHSAIVIDAVVDADSEAAKAERARLTAAAIALA